MCGFKESCLQPTNVGLFHRNRHQAQTYEVSSVFKQVVILFPPVLVGASLLLPVTGTTLIDILIIFES